MTRQELPWLLLGICIGLFIGAWLFAQHPPQPPRPCAKAQPQPEPAPGKILDPFREVGKAG